jgi:hypothetical protein
MALTDAKKREVRSGGAGAAQRIRRRASQARGRGGVPGRELGELVRAGQEVIPFPREDGLVAFMQVLGEAR